MKAAQFSSAHGKRQQAMALVMVITVVALMSILIVAIFSVTRVEYKSTQAYVASKSAQQLGDIGTAIVQAQITNAQNTSTSASTRTTHATQPGMVRVYKGDGSFSAAYKLYSSSTMKVTGTENSLYSDDHVPPSNWNAIPARYVDLNEPVVRPGLNAGKYAVYFPILDPRAAWNYNGGGQSDPTKVGTTQVEGFSYTKTAPQTGAGGGQDYSSSVITPTDTTDADNLRLPMPVEWLYILEDGTVGSLDASNKFVSPTNTVASADNPIIGRIAFWADDESCKININTASEPTFMSSPFYFHERDSKWAHFPGVTGEYQRYPGHPATVALSAVLAPNYKMDPLLPDSKEGFSGAMDIVGFKEQIYDLAPKVSGGGSEEGTRPFAQDDFSGQNGERSSAVAINLEAASKERLYASVDEMLFKDLDYNSSSGRSQAIINLPNGNTFFNHDILERSRFFLTAQSRSPEFNIHGLPRVSMWPVSDENILQPKWRTSFDNLIAFCSTIQKKGASSDYNGSYIFRRANARNGSSDLNITRNSKLLDYLVDQMSQLTWPATSYSSSSTSSNFVSKYGQDNVNQLAIQFFDYIRCTNLYDGITSRNNDAMSAYVANPPDQYKYIQSLYDYKDNNTDKCYTFTSQRMSPQPNSAIVSGDAASSNTQSSSASGGILPGHGQVSPAVWGKGGRSYKGFGRMITLSEIGFQFICTGDGYAPTNALTTFPLAKPFLRGGGSALRYNANDTDNTNANPDPVPATAAYPNMNVGSGPGVWWSNWPPLAYTLTNATSAEAVKAIISQYGCSTDTGRGSNPMLHPSKHPGFNPANWNMTLVDGVPLQEDEKRIQVMLLLETFCPSLGFTGLYPEFTIVLDGKTIDGMKIVNSQGQSQSLFSTNGDIPIKSYNNIYNNTGSGEVIGGHAGPSAISGGRRTRGISLGGQGTSEVHLPQDTNFDDKNTAGHNAMQNYTFCSDFVTVKRNQPLNVTFPSGDVKIMIYDTHNYESANPVQVLYVNFSSLASQIPVPNLAASQPYLQADADSYGRLKYTRAREGPHWWVANYDGCVGRLMGTVNPKYGQEGQLFWSISPTIAVAPDGNDAPELRSAQSIRGRLDTTAAISKETRTNITAAGISVISPDGTDVVRSIVPAMGDYRTLAARYNVPSSWWQVHPFAGNSDVFMAHSFTGFSATAEPGAQIAQSSPSSSGGYSYSPSLQLIGGALFNVTANGSNFTTLHPRQADLPPGNDYAVAANAFGDFDTGISNAREGPYINKPDEGNFFAGYETLNSQTKFFRSAYFFNTWQNADDWRSGIYMTPNRMISSPVMFGSLPTGVWGNPSGLPTGSSANQDFAPWQTLLFRPHAQVTNQDPNSQPSHPGMQDPSDHYLLDLFFMPVVEPYAISEPLSIAGRINMNYQIMPFTNIRRATGMHALMKGEFMTAIPNGHIVKAKEYYPAATSGTPVWDQRFTSDSKDQMYWHRPIDVPATLRQFDLKFSHQSGGQDSYQGLFRSASQICEMHLIPQIKGGQTIDPEPVLNATNQGQINEIMSKFWSANRPTGDNIRERPYSNLYARLTTRSNTFRVHVRAQVLKKARSTAPDVYDPTKDVVLSEYRGSTLLERYIDTTDTSADNAIPDYASSGITQQPLDTFYRFHALETKRFNP